jgi:Flp pilus assembly protein TadD
MYRHCSDIGRYSRWHRWLLVAAVAASGCAAQQAGSPPAGGGAEPAPAVAQAPGANAPPATVDVDEGVGFTVTEAVSITSATRETYRQALRHLAAGEIDLGIELLKSVVDEVPDATGPYVDLGIAYGRAERREEAIEALEAAVTATPDHPVAHNELGIAYRRAGRFEEARRSYERALEIFPGFHFARRNLAVLCDLYLADTACAMTHYEAYRAAVPDDPDVNMWLADLRNRAAAGNDEEI